MRWMDRIVDGWRRLKVAIDPTDGGPHSTAFHDGRALRMLALFVIFLAIGAIRFWLDGSRGTWPGHIIAGCAMGLAASCIIRLDRRAAQRDRAARGPQRTDESSAD